VLLYVPWLGVADWNCKLPGRRSVTVTVVATSGPLFVSVTVKVMTVPWVGVALLTVLVTARSAAFGITVTLAELLAAVGSNWSEWLMVAVFVVDATLATVAWMVRVAGVPGLTVPTVQTPVALLY